MSASLATTRGTRIVDHDILASLPDPVSKGAHHKPIRHDVLVQAIQEETASRGLHITKATYAITPQGEKFFGVFTFGREDAEKAWSLGIRNSVDRTLAIRGVAGLRVFVCDNMVLSGEQFIFHKKNTLKVDLPVLVKAGIDKYLPAAEKLDESVEALKMSALPNDAAKKLIYEAFVEHDVASIRLLPIVGEAYFAHGELGDNSFPDCTTNLWGLHNAFTRAFKGMKPASQYMATLRLGEAFGI